MRTQASWRRWFLASELRKVKVERTRTCSVVVVLLAVSCGSIEAIEPLADPRPVQQLAPQEPTATEQLTSPQLQVAPIQQSTAERLGIPAVIKNSVGIRLVLIPAGEFQMGCQEPAQDLVAAFAPYKRKPEDFSDEYPRHRVRITKPFYLGKCEVTVGEFRRFTVDAGYKTEAEADGEGGWGYNPATGRCEGRRPEFTWRNPGFPQSDKHPVLDVSWNDAAEFCQWLSRQEGKIYRLPTEAEWEYACRAGSTTRYSAGDDPNGLDRIAKTADAKGRNDFPHVADLIIPKGDNQPFTVPVGSFPPNAFGLCDMHGNVWEWCTDLYGEDYYASSPLDDPRGPDSGGLRVRRGGAWNSFPLWARSSFRNWNTPDSRCVNLGFRIALDLTEKFDSPTDSR